MFERVKEILSYYVEGYEITPDSDFMADLKMLSLEIVDFIIDLEKEYGIKTHRQTIPADMEILWLRLVG